MPAGSRPRLPFHQVTIRPLEVAVRPSSPMSSRRSDSPPSPAMAQAVEQMFRQLEVLAPDPGVVGACPELPGIVLHRIKGKVLDRQDPRYLDAISQYQSAHDD